MAVGDVLERTVKVHSINKIRDGHGDKGYWRMSEVKLSAKKADGSGWVQIQDRCKTFQNPPLDTEMNVEMTEGSYKDQREWDVDFGPGYRSFDQPAAAGGGAGLSEEQEKLLTDIHAIVDGLQSTVHTLSTTMGNLNTRLNEVAHQQLQILKGQPSPQTSMTDTFDAPAPAAPAPTPTPAAGPTPPPAAPTTPPAADDDIPF